MLESKDKRYVLQLVDRYCYNSTREQIYTGNKNVAAIALIAHLDLSP